MRRLTRIEFEQRFRRPSSGERIDGIFRDELHVDRDATIAGVVKGPLFIHANAHVVVSGVVEGAITIDDGAVLWCEPGFVEGRVNINGAGAALLTATVAGVHGGHESCVYDPCGPSDSESGN